MLTYAHAWLSTKLSDERGATAVEYGLMVALIAVAIIVTVGLLGDALDGLFGIVKDEVAGAAP